MAAGRRGGDLRDAGVGRAVAAGGRTECRGEFACDALGHAAHSSEAGPPKRGKRAGAQGWACRSCRPPPERIDERKEHRAECCPHCQGALQRCRNTHAIYRRHSRRHSAGGHRAHHPSRLVPALPEIGGAAGARRPARRPDRQPRASSSRPGCTMGWATRSRRSSRSSTITCNSRSRRAG